MQAPVQVQEPMKDIQIVYSNVGIDVWNTLIDLNDTVSDYSALVTQLNGAGKREPFFNHTLKISDPLDKIKTVNYLAKDPKCITEKENRLDRNMCENGCVAIYPSVVTVMNQHIQNAMDVSKNADLILLNEMCGDKIKSIPGTPLYRIKRKNEKFRAGSDWVDKVDLVAVGANLSGSKSFYFDKQGNKKIVNDILDENDPLFTVELPLAYNANLSEHKLPNGETLLVWFVHWPVLSKDYIFDEVTGIALNIENLLKKKPCNFIAIGDFNTNAHRNLEVFKEMSLRIKDIGDKFTKPYTTYRNFKGNDGYIACLNPEIFSTPVDDLKTSKILQPFSAHVPMCLTLKVISPPQSPQSKIPVILSSPQSVPISLVQSSPQSAVSLQQPISQLSLSVPVKSPVKIPPSPQSKIIAVPPRKNNKMVEVGKEKALELLTTSNAKNALGIDDLILNTLANNFNAKSKLMSIHDVEFELSVYTQLKQVLRFDPVYKSKLDQIELLKPKLEALISDVLKELRSLHGGSLEKYSQNKKHYLMLNNIM